jgi:hypothetical protein
MTISMIRKKIKTILDITTYTDTVKTGKHKGNICYIIKIKYVPEFDEFDDFFSTLHAKKDKDYYSIIIE